MSGFEALDVHKFIMELKNDTVLKGMFPDGNVIINGSFAKEEPPPLYIVFTMVSGKDVNSMSGDRIMTRPQYSIVTIGKEVSLTILRSIVERIDYLVTKRDAAVTIGTTYVCRFIRDSVFVHTESLNKVRWESLGAIYNVIAFSIT
jgi:hypothetical protein